MGGRTDRPLPSGERRRNRTCARGRAPLPPAQRPPERSRDTCRGSPAAPVSVQNPSQQSLHEKSGDLYFEGIRIAGAIKDLDGPNLNPLCRSRLYTHGRPVERSLVLLHGFTNCPQQFDALGRQFYERGWNVFIPRYPRHGYTDRLNTTIAQLRSDHLLAVANRAAEAGSAPGERLTVAGLSLRGILTGMVAPNRQGVSRALLIPPTLALSPI